jgi:hypothetical protein
MSIKTRTGWRSAIENARGLKIDGHTPHGIFASTNYYSTIYLTVAGPDGIGAIGDQLEIPADPAALRDFAEMLKMIAAELDVYWANRGG